jgi:hypothetical protein
MSETVSKTAFDEKASRPDIDLTHHTVVLALVSLICLIMNTAGPGIAVGEGLIGMVVIYAITMIGLVLTKAAPFYLPSVAWISLVGILLTLPWTPGSEWIVTQVKNVNFLSLATPALAYAGFAIARNEIETAKRSGWKLALVAAFVFIGTYLGSVLVAEVVIGLQGI